MIVLSQPILVTWQAWSLPILTFLLFVRSFENEAKKKSFSHFIFCRAARLFAVTILPVLASTTGLVTLVIENMTSAKSSKIFHETGFGATCQLSHQSPHETDL